jgi:hypothetical protein
MMVRIALALLAIAIPASAEASWRYNADRDPFTDERASTAIQTNPGTFGASLIIRCKAGVLESYYVPSRYLGSSSYAYVRYRFDREEPQSGSWSLSTSGQAVFSDTAVEFARSVVRGSRLVIEAEDFSGTGQIPEFSLAGSSSPVSRVLADCMLMPTDPRAADDAIWRRVAQSVDELSVENAEFVGELLDTIFDEAAPHGDRRRLAIYQSMTTLYLATIYGCENGNEPFATLPSCVRFLQRRERDPEASYPIEAVQMLLKVLEAD